MKITHKNRHKRYEKAVKEAYCLLVSYRKLIEENEGISSEYAKSIEETYKQLWCECLNEKAPWT